MTTRDNQLAVITSGASDWDTDLDANFTILERGFHISERAGVAVNTGQVLWQNSGGFFFPFDPNSVDIFPHALALTAAASGDSTQMLAWGIVRSLAINSLAVPGKSLFVSVLTPGQIVLSNSGTNRKIGFGLPGYGIVFQPSRVHDHDAVRSLGGIDFTGLSDGKVLAWSDATSIFTVATPEAGGGGGVTKIQSLSDVDPSGLGNNSILKWSNTSSKFVMAVDSTGGGGGTSVGSPPAVVQAAISLGRNVVTFVTSPASGNYLVGMTWNPLTDVLAAGWTLLNKTTSGTDFAVMGGQALTGGSTLVQTFDASSSATMLTIMFELHGGKGVTPKFIAANVGNSVGGVAPNLPAFPNILDMISIHGVGFVSGASSLSAIYNVTSAVFANSGTVRQGAGGWSWSDRAVAQMIATLTASAETKGMIGLFSS